MGLDLTRVTGDLWNRALMLGLTESALTDLENILRDHAQNDWGSGTTVVFKREAKTLIINSGTRSKELTWL